MKQLSINLGGRKFFNEDFVILNDLSVFLEKMVTTLADKKFNIVVVAGFERTSTAISSGLCFIKMGNQYKIATFNGFNMPSNTSAVYVFPELNVTSEEYDDGVVRPIINEYSVQMSLTEPGEDDQILWDFEETESTITNFQGILQDSVHRMVSDAQISFWNAKAPATHQHTATQVTQTASYRFVTDIEKGTWNAARTGAVADVRGGVESDFDTLLKLFEWVSDTFNSYALAVHNHTAAQITESTTKRFITDTERTTWNAARTGAVADIRDNIVTAYNTLNKLYSYINTQLATKAAAAHTHAAADIIESTTKRFITDTERTTWNAARTGAVSDVRGGVSSTYDTLKKLLDYANAQLDTKMSNDNNISWTQIALVSPYVAGLYVTYAPLGLFIKETQTGEVRVKGYIRVNGSNADVVIAENLPAPASNTYLLMFDISEENTMLLCINTSGQLVIKTGNVYNTQEYLISEFSYHLY